MAAKTDAHHVVNFTLLKIGTVINLAERRYLSLALRLGCPNPKFNQTAGMAHAVKLVVDFDAVLVMHALKAG
jgi:hypothetical protein